MYRIFYTIYTTINLQNVLKIVLCGLQKIAVITLSYFIKPSMIWNMPTDPASPTIPLIFGSRDSCKKTVLKKAKHMIIGENVSNGRNTM
ncbi:hypothetical protein GDO78_011693 [Eleutherodactylus coqui]|uniref:Uncharacterized protein n=1 Tax=Eleutherodactylus coqui TaxID=57060 RepID=A0A8J6F2B7_ELECQ|nr:hypothetical protein GDO78_011693 [Eleutherodactylus coqui]